MRLIELLIEGVPATKGVLQYRFDSGLNPWKQTGSFPLASLVDIVSTLLFPASRENEPLGPGKCRKATLQFEAKGAVYSISRDYVSKRNSLSELEKGTDDRFREISTELRFISQTMNRLSGFPSTKVFRRFVVAKKDFSEPENSFAVSIREAPPLSMDASKELDILKAERQNLLRLKEGEARIDDLQHRTYQIEEELQRLVRPRQEVARIEQEYEHYQIFDREGLVTPQLLAKLKAFPKVKEKYETDLKSLGDRADEMTAELTRLPRIPWWKEPMFMGSALLAVGAFVAGIVNRNWLTVIWLPLSILGWILGGVAYYLNFQRGQKIAELQKKLNGIDPEKLGIQKRFDIETQVTRNFFKVVQEDDVEEIDQLLSRWQSLKEELRLAQEGVKEIERQVPEKDLKQERDSIRKEITSIEQKIADIPPVSMDPNSLDLRIRELETKTGVRSTPTREVMTSEHPVEQLLVAATELLGRKTADIFPQIQKALNANVNSVSERRYSGVNFDGNQVLFMPAGQTSGKSWFEIPEEDQPILLFGIQFTLWQLLSNARPTTFWIDVTVGNSDRYEKVTLAAAKYLAQRSQMVVLSR